MSLPHERLIPITATPVTAATRLAYVLQHFRAAYAAEELPSIGYADAQPLVTVADGAADFFEGAQPYPPEPSRREWQGRQLPFFFDPNPAGPLLTRSPGRAEIHVDVVSAAFYLLSGWQEYFSEERDQHGRFPYSASVQQRYGFVAVPVVNYYFDVLRTAVEHVTGRPLHPRHWNGTPFATFVTHDIDNLYSAWKEPAKQALRRRDWLGFGRQLWRHLARPDAWDNLELVQQTVASYGAASTFFFILNHGRSAENGPSNADYRFHQLLPRIRQLGSTSEIGLHGSLGSGRNSQQLWAEADTLSRDLATQPTALGLRFHYLQWEPRITPEHLDDLGILYDSTLGFAEHFGFRHSYCLPFQPFNFRSLAPHSFLELPLNLMDATLHHPRYLQLAPDEILPAVEPMLQEIERFGGVFTLLWHNENFDPANTTNGPREFHRIMAYLRSRQTAFLTGRAICEMVKL
ncbi:hypothetical protein LJ737_19305 [Hymenobacter sp. 15J16-1T3B]|uniref:DUF7033 domain-containing protein n=1 Tax=Hymenobacter sp. 15J16-1T3B TaxID=2886941 RepID=UPI001D117FD4|nr:hypothetical protein [Hymenobacter sp. 15J16-1T3B]MCC3159398.1 hypothetical protein [Hymenobacter sp. 15J16-1T3B]